MTTPKGLDQLATCILFGLLLSLPGALPAWQSTPPPDAEHEQSIETTRDLLDGGIIRPTRPWYDARTDDVRRLDLRIRRQQTSWNVAWLSTLMEVLGWVGVALAVLLLAFIAWRVHKYWRHRDSDEDAGMALALDEETSDVDRVEALPFRVTRQAADLLGEASRQYEKGNYSEAIIYLFSHQLVELDRQHLIHLARGKTNRQVARELTSRELRLLVEQTMVAFEDVFFGGHTLSRARFEACWFELPRFDRLVREAAV
jgi:hypothetical protein